MQVSRSKSLVIQFWVILDFDVVQWVVLVPLDLPQVLLRLELLGVVGDLEVHSPLGAQCSHGVLLQLPLG